jgi:hypothetical protein
LSLTFSHVCHRISSPMLKPQVTAALAEDVMGGS